MGCKTCDIGCVMITADCLCSYTGLNGIDPDNEPAVINRINSLIRKIIGKECLEKLCSDEFDEQRNTAEFKSYYSQLFLIEWLRIYGRGQISKGGLRVRESDDYSAFSVVSYKELQNRISDEKTVLEMFEQDWIELFKEENPDCFECENSLPCGCVSVCGCKNNPSPKQIKQSGCGGNCDKCSCNDSGKLQDIVLL